MDDRVTTLTVTAYQNADSKLPEPADVINYKHRKTIGIAYETDARGYALIHTARPMLVQELVSECKVNSVEEYMPGPFACGYRQVTIKTTILNTREA
jgi:hypothetical protein